MSELMSGIGHREGIGAIGHALAGEDFDASGLASQSGSMRSWSASARFSLISRGAVTGVGATRAKKFAGRAAQLLSNGKWTAAAPRWGP